jgi:hypothetical protein
MHNRHQIMSAKRNLLDEGIVRYLRMIPIVGERQEQNSGEAQQENSSDALRVYPWDCWTVPVRLRAQDSNLDFDIGMALEGRSCCEHRLRSSGR